MKKVVLDTNFILTCIRNKIDFMEDISFQGMQILIPNQVIGEIKRINESKKKLRFREEANLALKILEKTPIRKINLNEKNVDKGLIKLAEKDKEIIIATLDKEIKSKIKTPKLVILRKKKLEII